MTDSVEKKSAKFAPLYLTKTSGASSATSIVESSSTVSSAALSIATNASEKKKLINVQCLLCDKQYQFYSEKDDYLAHLFLEHRLVIADEEQVAIFDEYLKFWREKLADDPSKLPEYCTTMHLDHLPDGTPSKEEKYFLLADILPLDNELRSKLQVKRLEMALAQHQFERTDTTFERVCLYCRDIIKPTRADYLVHLFSKHFLQLGKSENLVYVDELIDTVQDKMANLICIYCEKEFKDRPILKEHMRKKGHKRINPDNKNYDKFFLVNYKNEKQSSYGQRMKHAKQPNAKTRVAAKPSQHSVHEKRQQQQTTRTNASRENRSNRRDELSFSDTDGSDWEGEQEVLTCLYCPLNNTDFNKLKLHIKEEHHVDFDRLTEKLSFYDRVKIVNFVRRQMHLLKCLTCGEQFTTTGDLQQHLRQQQHYGIGKREQWDLSEYFFPTYEDDAFLCSLDDTHDTDDEAEVTAGNDASVVVHPEDTKTYMCINPYPENNE